MTHGAGSFPRGFLLAHDPVDRPPGYSEGPVLPNFYVHPWAAVEAATDPEGRFVVIVGTCVSTSSTSDAMRAAEALLWAYQDGEGTLLAALDRYSGRHAILYGRGDEVRIVNDATAMRSVFYATAGGVVASHAVLVARALGGKADRDDLPFRGGYPGNSTPYPGVRLLTANTLYDVSAGKVCRFWPIRAVPELPLAHAAGVLLDRSVTALRNMARHLPVKIALTAGLDSRTVLAVALRASVEFETYTYGRGPDTLMDRNLSAEIAAAAGVRHTIVPSVPLSTGLRKHLEDAHYSGHHRNAVASLSSWIDDPRSAAVTANLLEIGRSFYKGRRNAGKPAPTTAEAMVDLHYSGMGRRAKEEIAEWGEDRFRGVACEAFEEFIADTDYGVARGVLDPFDQFYWEHRMSAWHGTAMNERDFYAEPFIPFNSRAVFEAMLGVPQAERDAGAVQRAMIAQVDPRLLDLPVNPPSWPRETP